jgi:hypothetical protein
MPCMVGDPGGVDVILRENTGRVASGTGHPRDVFPAPGLRLPEARREPPSVELLAKCRIRWRGCG